VLVHLDDGDDLDLAVLAHGVEAAIRLVQTKRMLAEALAGELLVVVAGVRLDLRQPVRDDRINPCAQLYLNLTR
jgi:hypothetical protein